MPKTSVLIPSRNEPYTAQTVHDVFGNATGDIEVLVALEAWWPPEWDKVAEQYPGRLITVYHGQPLGMRGSLNQLAAISRGDYLLKTDAHCAFSKGFDETLTRDCPSRTVMVPRRYRLQPETWSTIEDGRLPVDYEYLAYPNGGDGGMKGKNWEARTRERKDILIDPTMCAQGSCWFMPRSYFYDLDLLDEANYGSFWKEMAEIALKAWLSGGQVLTHKGCSYSHWHKPKRGYSMDDADLRKAVEYSNKWLTDSTGWKKQTRSIKSLVQQFNPPGWPAEYYQN